MTQPNGTERLPTSVKLAAALFLLYGAAVLLNAILMQRAGGWAAALDFPRAVFRLIATGLVAWGLLHRERWAWWLGVILAAFWLAMGALAVGVLERGDLYWLRPSGFQIFLVVSLLALFLALALLLSPPVRRVFRPPPGSTP
jgi:peptidoglycan/LPS O-acetylase OafA/YrhL